MLEISLLGPLEVRLDGEPVDISGDIARRIVAGLSTEQPVHPERLIDLAWGSDPPREAKAALQTQISRLRGRLGREAIIGSGAGYSLRDAAVDIDRFSELIQSDDAAQLSLALDLVRGEPLADLTGADELTGTRRALEELVQNTRIRLAEALIDEGRASEAIPLLELLTASAPLFEPGWLALARAAHAAGRQADAIATLDRYRQAVADAGLEPSPAMSLVEDEVFRPPPTASRSPRRSGVRERRSSFVGRDAEVAGLVEALRSHRIVTVTGPGGMGKTRLAEKAAVASAPSLPGGVVEVELDTDITAEGVPAAIARAFGVRAGDDPLEAVSAAVGTDPTLLLMDNCEHVADAVSRTADRLLDDTPSLTILTTSRQPLGMDGELLHALGPLDPDGEAVQLFFDRATDAGDTLEAADAALIRQLCRRLDGMPLAIEMAAARMRSVTPAELLDLLDHSYQVLEASRPERRHHTLDALVEWSYGRLSTDEQRMFRTLGVFAGGFLAGDAAAVLGWPIAEAVRVLGRLVDRSMCQARRTGGATEYRLLQTLRAVARDRLSDDAEIESVTRAHGKWAAGISMRVSSMPAHDDDARGLERLVSALPDVVAAHRRARERGDLDLQIRLLGPLFPLVYLMMPPGIAEPVGATLEHVADPDHPFLPWLDSVAAAYELAAGRPEVAHRHLSNARGRTHGDTAWPVWFMAGDLAVYEGDLEAADRANRQVVKLESEAGTDHAPSGWADGLINLAICAAYAGRLDEARTLAQRALARARAQGGLAYRALAEYAVGEVHQDLDPRLALEHLHRAVELSSAAGIPFVDGIARTTISSVLARIGDHHNALLEFRGLIDLLERTGARVHLWTALRNLVVLLADMSAWEDVARLLGLTGDRVCPTYGDEAIRLANAEQRARDAFAGFDEVLEEGRSTAIAEAGGVAKRAIDRHVAESADSAGDLAPEPGLRG